MILVDLLTGVGPGVVGVAWVVVAAGPGDSDGAAIGAGVSDSVTGSLGVTGVMEIEHQEPSQEYYCPPSWSWL